MSLLIEVEPEPPRPPDDGVLFVDRRVIAFRAPALLEILTVVWMDGGTGMRARAVRFITSRQLLQVDVDMHGARAERSMRAGDILPVLIAWCIGARIALPSQAEKAVRVTAGGVVLDCGITHLSLPPYRRRRPGEPRVLAEWER